MTHEQDEHEHDEHDHGEHNEHEAHEHEAHHHHGHGHAQSGITAAKPILNVANAAASLRYYVERLGFELVFAWCDDSQSNEPGGVPTFGEVRRGEAAVMLAQGEQGGRGMWIYLDVHSRAELEALHEEFARKGATITLPPGDRPWGMREMLVQDLDGHTLRLGAPLEDE